ncbi:MAG: M1 family metallopeptidase [Thermoanaerobaculia bacterium]|nr:M1 family metallopeptidase [Thermoanaerobaculia bacterium]
MSRRALVVAAIIVCFACPLHAADFRLGTTVTPTYQLVELKIDPEQKSYSGLTRVSLRVNEPTATFRLHAEEIEISKVRLDGPGGTIPLKFTIEKDVVTLRAPRILGPGNYSLRIDFTNEFNTRAVGLYRMEAGGRAYAFTQFEAIDARKAFPCWDEPSFKQPFQLRLTVRDVDEAVTNTPVARVRRENGWKTIEFERTEPMPTYLVAIAVGPMDSIPVEGLSIPGRIYTPHGQAHLASIAAGLVAPILADQERWFGMKYPYRKLDFIAIPEYWPGAMEHPGAVTFSDRLMLLDPVSANPNTRRRLAQVIAHELAHMWFGDLVTMQWWDDLWLNESFADWFGDKTTAKLFPQYKVELGELQNVQRVMLSDASAGADAVRKPVTSDADMLGDVGLAYNKGKSVLGMFESWLGPDVFRRGVNEYLRAHAWGNATASDLFSSLSSAAGFPVGPAMASFLDQPGIPLVEVRILDGGRVRLSQRRLANAGTTPAAQTWKIPVALRYSDGKSVATKSVLLDAASMELELVPNGRVAWVIPMADATGYYRWTVDHDALLTLANNAQRDMNAAERVAYFGNLRALLDAGLIHGDDYFRALRAFASDPEPRVVSSVLAALDDAMMAFVTDEVSDDFSTWVRGSLRPALDRIGLERREDEEDTVSILRPSLVRWLGAYGADPEVIAWCAEQTKKYMQDPASVDPSVSGTALSVTARYGGEALFDEMSAKLAAAATPGERSNYLAALGAFRAPAARAKALQLALEGKLRPNEMFVIPFGGTDSPAGRDEMYGWLTSNYETVASRMPPLYLPYLAGVGGGCEADRLAKARAFFTDPKRKVQGMEERLAETEQQVNDCVGLRAREGARVAEYLERPE